MCWRTKWEGGGSSTANRPCLEGLGFAHGNRSTGLVVTNHEPPLRDSAGISPDFAGFPPFGTAERQEDSTAVPMLHCRG